MALAVAASAVLGLGGCGDDGTVELGYRPEPGTTYDYVTEVRSTTTTALPGVAPDVREDITRLDVRQTVVDADADGAAVTVALSRPGAGTRTVAVRLDRAAQLTAVTGVEGISADVLGELGLSEIFPSAAGAPPARPLAPGERWRIDDDISLAGSDRPLRLTGEGRLVRLGVEDGREVATVTSTTSLPVERTTTTAQGDQTLTGTQRTTTTATYDLTDGAVVRAESATTASYRLVLAPPPALADVAPVEGTLTLRLESRVTEG
jgi:hypothetical protein